MKPIAKLFGCGSSPYEREMERREQARELWTESEWVLECLRSKTGTPLNEVSEEQIVEWYNKLDQP